MTLITIQKKRLLHKNQLEIFDNLARFSVITAGRRFGKTRLAVFIIVTKALERMGVYWWVSPSYKVQTSAWRLIKSFLSVSFGDSVRINETSRTIYLPNGSIIEFRSADKPQDLVSEGLSGLVMDECADVKEEAWTVSLRPTLADNQGWAVFIGTPEGRNWFFHIYKQAEKQNDNIWRAFHYTSYDNPYIEPSEIELMKKDMSEREARQEIYAEFVSEGGVIYRKEWFKTRREPLKILRTYISWDTASTTNKDSAYSSGIVGHIASDYKLYIAEVYREKLEFPELEYRVEALANNYLDTLRGIVIENKASGIQVIQSLTQTSKPEISRQIFPFNPKGSKIERGYQASKWCEKGMVILPPYSEQYSWLLDFEDELLSFPDSEYADQADAFNQLILFSEPFLERGLNN